MLPDPGAARKIRENFYGAAPLGGVASSLFPVHSYLRHPSPEGEASEGGKFPLRQGNRLVSDCPENAPAFSCTPDAHLL